MAPAIKEKTLLANARKEEPRIKAYVEELKGKLNGIKSKIQQTNDKKKEKKLTIERRKVERELAAEQCALEKTQAEIAYYKKMIQNGLTISTKRTDKQIVEDLEEKKRSIEFELKGLSEEKITCRMQRKLDLEKRLAEVKAEIKYKNVLTDDEGDADGGLEASNDEEEEDDGGDDGDDDDKKE